MHFMMFQAKTTEESTGTDIAAKSINAARTTASFKGTLLVFWIDVLWFSAADVLDQNS